MCRYFSLHLQKVQALKQQSITVTSSPVYKTRNFTVTHAQCSERAQLRSLPGGTL